MGQELYRVTFFNPGIQMSVSPTFVTREEAEARAKHYAEKYRQFRDYVPAKVVRCDAD